MKGESVRKVREDAENKEMKKSKGKCAGKRSKIQKSVLLKIAILPEMCSLKGLYHAIF